MKNIVNFIFEKLKISKDMETGPEPDPRDPTTWRIGDIVCGTWGYSMTLPEWYRIVGKTAKSFKVEHIPGKIVSGHRNGFWEELPDLEAKGKDQQTVRIRKGGYVKIDNIYAHLWDGEKTLHGDDMD